MTELEAMKILKDKQQAARQAVRLGRSRWEECADCWLWKRQNFCPECGRPITEEAWAELERRISDG